MSPNELSFFIISMDIIYMKLWTRRCHTESNIVRPLYGSELLNDNPILTREGWDLIFIKVSSLNMLHHDVNSEMTPLPAVIVLVYLLCIHSRTW